METHRILEILFLCLTVGLFGGYHLWIFWVLKRSHPQGKISCLEAKLASCSTSEKELSCPVFMVVECAGNWWCRDAWARECSKAQDAAGQTYIIQTLRNSITASSLLATACSLIAVTGVSRIILDEQQVSVLEQIVRNDPILNGNAGLISPKLKLAIIEGLVLFTFLFFTQSIRLTVNLGFYGKLVHSEMNKGFYLEEEMAAISRRAAICFTLGIRSFYALIPLIFWVAGPTWMLSVCGLLVISLILTDHIAPAKRHKQRNDIETGSSGTTSKQTPVKSGNSDRKIAAVQD